MKNPGVASRGNVSAAVALALLVAAVAFTNAPAFDSELARARSRAAEGRAYISLRILDELLGEDPGNREALALRAEIFRRNGRLELARQDYKRWTLLHPGDATAWFWLATVDRWRGQFRVAIAEYDRVLAIEPCHGDALTGRSRAWRAVGREKAAEADLHVALECRPGEREATELLEDMLAGRRSQEAGRRSAGLAPAQFAFLDAEHDRNEVIEGLEEDGLVVNGAIVVPAEILYETSRVRGGWNAKLSESLELHTEFAIGREAVENLTHTSPIYDFDRVRGLVGLSHRISREWRLSWRVGGSGYRSNEAATISEENDVAAEAEVEFRGVDARFTGSYHRDTFVRRGFAGDFQFRIFRRDRWELEYRRSFLEGIVAEAGVRGTHYDDGNDVFFSSATLGWSRTWGGVWLRFRHDPFPARFFGPDLELDFVDYDVITLAGRRTLPRGIRLSGEVLAGRFGETPRSEIDGKGRRVDRQSAHNFQRRARATISWKPFRVPPWSVGAEYFSDEYDFDTAPYNTINAHAWTLFGELEIRRGASWRGRARYEHRLIGDERDSSYTSHTASLRAEGPRFAAEARLGDNSLDEETRSLFAELTVPF